MGGVRQRLAAEAWVSKRKHVWFSKLFLFLASLDLRAEPRRQLQALPVFPLEDGSLGKLESGPVFLPLKRGVEYGFESEIRQVHHGLFSGLEASKSERLHTFLNELGINRPDPVELIDHHILPVYENEGWKQKPGRVPVGHIKYIRNEWKTYEAAKKKHDPKWHLSQLGSKVVLRVRTSGVASFAVANTLYLSREFKPPHDLEGLFSKSAAARFVEANSYLKTKLDPEALERSVTQWRAFLTALGVRPEYRGRCSPPSLIGNSPTDAAGRARSQRRQTTSCHRSASRLSVVPTLMRLQHSSGSTMSTGALCSLGISPDKGFYRTAWTENPESKMLLDLRSVKVPSVSGEPVQLGGGILNTPELRELLGPDSPCIAVPLKNPQFLQHMGISAQPSVQAVVGQLRRWSDQGVSPEPQRVRRLYLWLASSSASALQDEFSKYSLLFLPALSPPWRRASSVFWEVSPGLLGRSCPGLERTPIYSGLREFFVGTVGVRARPGVSEVIEHLKSLADEDETGDRDDALRCYLALDALLREDAEPSVAESIASEFREHALWRTTKGEWWKDDGDLFLGDSEALAALFEAEASVAFIDVPPEKVAELGYTSRSPSDATGFECRLGDHRRSG